MKRIIYINTGINIILFPFKKWLKGVKYISATQKITGFDQYEREVLLLDKDKNVIPIPHNLEICRLCKLWEEECLSDFLHNVVSDCILDNTQSNKETEEIFL